MGNKRKCQECNNELPDILDKRIKYCRDCSELIHITMKQVYEKYIPKEELERFRKYCKYDINKRNTKTRKKNMAKITHAFDYDEWLDKLNKTKGICPGCKKNVGIEHLTLDHILPVSKVPAGFVYTINDVQPLCKSCNSRKGNG